MVPDSANRYDTIVVGGGLVGAAVAFGMARRGRRVGVFDGGDRDFRASRGNFGLVWVQGKGADYAPYARLSGAAASCWSDFAAQLLSDTGIDVGLEQNGGYDFCLEQAEWDARASEMSRVAAHTDGEFEYEMLGNAELRQRIPEVSDEVLGASYSPLDGHVNPLYLLRALHQRLLDLGAAYHGAEPVVSSAAEAGRFVVTSARGRYRCERLVFCAGLANQRLAADLGMHIPLQPLRGQLLITERVPRFLPCATLQVRQTMEGTLQIGDSHEDVGYDESTTLEVITRLAARAVRIFPHLRHVRLQRAWGALRVMTPDGNPVYQQSRAHAGAYAISCHSGVTLAAMHAGPVAAWLCGEPGHPLIGEFPADRFDVSAA
ncbi:MAG: FAD-binding oxidoreductase [Gammaproteobacteria bacterium]|nr:MAG: FAD-binding oxidoreductase [Gammaproteobacteria bacterium]